MAQLFDYLKSLTSKNPRYCGEELINYNPWMVNRFLTDIPELLPVLEEINGGYNLTYQQHYDLLFEVIPKSKRFLKYNLKKENKEKDLTYVMEYYQVNYEVAKSYVELIAKDELKQIKDHFEKRGITKKGKK